MKEHTKNCASYKNKYDGDYRDRYPNEMRDCDCDGYHTFSELYEHRIELWITVCRGISYRNAVFKSHGTIMNGDNDVWRSKNHSDGEPAFGGSWFVLGIGKKIGNQKTYHLPIEKWDDTSFAEKLEKAPEFDGHTSDDVLERLKKL